MSTPPVDPPIGDHEFDRMLASLRSVPVRPHVQDQHLSMLADLVEADRRAADRRRGWRRAGVLAAAVLVGMVAGMGTMALLGGSTDRPTVAHGYCYAAQDPGRVDQRIEFEVAQSVDAPDLRASGADEAAVAKEVCSVMWHVGELLPDGTVLAGGDSSGRQHAAPALVACELTSGDVGVFPGEQGLCVATGLTPV